MAPWRWSGWVLWGLLGLAFLVVAVGASTTTNLTLQGPGDETARPAMTFARAHLQHGIGKGAGGARLLAVANVEEEMVSLAKGRLQARRLFLRSSSARRTRSAYDPSFLPRRRLVSFAPRGSS